MGVEENNAFDNLNVIPDSNIDEQDIEDLLLYTEGGKELLENNLNNLSSDIKEDLTGILTEIVRSDTDMSNILQMQLVQIISTLEGGYTGPINGLLPSEKKEAEAPLNTNASEVTTGENNNEEEELPELGMDRELREQQGDIPDEIFAAIINSEYAKDPFESMDILVDAGIKNVEKVNINGKISYKVEYL